MRSYQKKLNETGGKLILTGVSKNVFHQLERTGFIDQIGKENIYSPSLILGDQLRKAWNEAEKYIQSRNR
jgi:hypothetical protein